ncbi:hypothetical protein DID88_003258 [Monilinia fructigena]|uniref:Uncharacterized protein n=1 Tax=Monilinia fructigena TaxID=38457 RepID=A0A395IUT6_9HELO|nr:hypothetical protein DID88_003258 [Monilinia fructigena]
MADPSQKPDKATSAAQARQKQNSIVEPEYMYKVSLRTELNPEALATVVRELRKDADEVRKQVAEGGVGQGE